MFTMVKVFLIRQMETEKVGKIGPNKCFQGQIVIL